MPNIWRLRRVRDTKFGMNVSNEMLLNARVAAFIVSELLRENQQGGGGGGGGVLTTVYVPTVVFYMSK